MSNLLTVTDLKQYAYCPRILYYMRCLPAVRPVTAKMAEGILAHREEEAREQRRQLRSYGFATGERQFSVPIQSIALGLNASVDMLILRPDGQEIVVPVDFKYTREASAHFRLQLACYGLLLEEETGLPAPYGFLYLIPERRAEKVILSRSQKLKVQAVLADMREIIDTEQMPESTPQRGKCVNCEFRRFCNDVA